MICQQLSTVKAVDTVARLYRKGEDTYLRLPFLSPLVEGGMADEYCL